MSGAEFILFLFIFALISFASILRRRLSGAQRDAEQSQARETWEEQVEPDGETGISDRQQAAPHPVSIGDMRGMLARKLAELVDGQHRPADELRTAPPTVELTEQPPMKVRLEPAPPSPTAAPPTAPDLAASVDSVQAWPPANRPRADDIRRALRDSESVRQAILLKEVLDKPVALRGFRQPAR